MISTLLNTQTKRIDFGKDTGSTKATPYIPKQNVDVPVTIKNYSESQIVQFVMDRLYGATEAVPFRKMVDSMPIYNRAYNGQFRNNNYPKWRSQLFVRLSFRAVETLRAYMQDALFGNVPYIVVDGSHPKYVASAKNLQKLYDYEMYHTKFEHRLLHVLNFVLKYGTAVTKTYWRYYLDYMHVNQFKRNKNGFVERDGIKGKKYAKYDDPWFSALDPRKVYPDPMAAYSDELRYIIEEYETDIDQLIKDKERYGYINLHLLFAEQPSGSMYGTRFDYYADMYPRNHWRSRDDENRKRVFISKYVGRLDLPGNHDDPRIYNIEIANCRHVIRLKPSSYAHGEIEYQFHSIIPQEESLYGIGCIEPILTDNYILNALTNMRIDAMQYFLNPRILVNRGALADRESINWTQPGGIINVNTAADLDRATKQIAVEDTGITTFQNALNFHLQHAEESMALNPNAAGALSRSRRSATEASMAMEGANARFTSMVKYLKYSGFDSMIRQYGQLMQQYIGERHFPIVNPENEKEKDVIMKVRPEDIQGEFLFRIRDNTITNKDIRQQLITNLLGVLAPFAQTLNMNFTPLLKGLLEMSPVAGQLNLDQLFPESQTPEAMGTENKTLERMAAEPEGRPGYAAPGTPAVAAAPGMNAEMQTLMESMAGLPAAPGV
jgi:hypothetical protein